MAETQEKKTSKPKKATAAVEDVAAKVSEAASEAIESAAVAVDDARKIAEQRVSAGLQKVAEVGGDIGGRVTAKVRKHPMRTILLAAAGAAIAGFLIKAFTAERS